MADDDEATIVGRQELAKPSHGICIEVVRRLVEKQHIGTAEQDACKLDASSLAAGERAEGLGENSIRKAHGGCDGGRL
ncbi:unannotated protein [freshwater metagenome]|uniref:Unannotated protein n=1 Tax=freshwater metagenome TaxID=449393 RepID=A0A6J6T6E1_9ZZZZ